MSSKIAIYLFYIAYSGIVMYSFISTVSRYKSDVIISHVQKLGLMYAYIFAPVRHSYIYLITIKTGFVGAVYNQVVILMFHVKSANIVFTADKLYYMSNFIMLNGN